MGQLHLYVSAEIERKIRRRAEAERLPVSKYLARIAARDVGEAPEWPANYFDSVFGRWEGDPLQRPPQGEYERREEW